MWNWKIYVVTVMRVDVQQKMVLGALEELKTVCVMRCVLDLVVEVVSGRSEVEMGAFAEKYPQEYMERWVKKVVAVVKMKEVVALVEVYLQPVGLVVAVEKLKVTGQRF